MNESRIKEAAIRSGDKVYTGTRHCIIIREMRDAGCSRGEVAQANQGFITEDGVFLTRRQALVRAIVTGQVDLSKKMGNRNELFSEDLY